MRAKRTTKPPPHIDYFTKAELPVRDIERDGRVAFIVMVYGWSQGDASISPGGGYPARKAINRLGLSRTRYFSTVFDT